MTIRLTESYKIWDATKHGVTGDGTTNDSAACQTLLSNAAAAGAIVWFPAKTYRIADVWTPSNTHLVFAAGVTLKLPTSGITTTDPCHFRLATSDRTTGTVTDITLEGGPVTSDMTSVGDSDFSGGPRSIHMINVIGFSTQNLVLWGKGVPPTAGNVYVVGPNTKGVAPMNGTIGGGGNISVRGIGSSFIQNLGCTNVTQIGRVYVDGGVCLRNEMDGNPYTAENVHGLGPYYSDGASGYPNTLIYFIPHGNKMKNMSARNGRATGGVHGVKIAYDIGNTPDSLDGITVSNVHVTGGGYLSWASGASDIIPRMFTLEQSSVSGSSGDGVIMVPGVYRDIDSHDNAGNGFTQSSQSGNAYPRRYVVSSCRSESNVGGSGYVLNDAQAVVELVNSKASEPHTGAAGPNLLTTNQASLETAGVSGWGVQDGNTTISTSTAWANAGTVSLSITRTSTTGAAVARTTGGTGGVSVTPGVIYSASAVIRASGTVRNSWVTIRWFDSTGTQIVPDSVGASSNDSSVGVTHSVSGTAPVGAKYANLMVTIQNCPAGELHMSDSHVLQQTAVAAVQNYGITISGGTAIISDGDYSGNISAAINRSGGKVYGTFRGTASPEGAVTASVGSTYRRTDGTASTSFYVKESGDGNTGWAAK